MSQRLREILTEEGLEIYQPNSLRVIPADCQKAAIDLFRFLPELTDPRWTIAYSWSRARQCGIRPIHEETAQSAKYLATKPGYRNGYSSFQSEENLRLIARASVNLNSLRSVQNRFDNNRHPPGGENYQVHLTLTNKITRGTCPDGTTGCPEALYQLQLRSGGHYLGRVGFNLHRESKKEVVSISNIQGIPGGQQLYIKYESEVGDNPFITLVSQVKRMFPDLMIRGIKNPPINPQFYNTVFAHAGISRKNYLSR